MVGLLLEKGAEVNAKGYTGATPLLIAAKTDHPEVAKVLLEKGAAVDAKNDNGDTPLSIATQNGHLEVVKLLLNSHAAVDAKASDGGTPLLLASQEGYLDVVKLLLANGAAVNAAGNNGATSLFLAAGFKHPDVVKLLLDKGATVDAKVNNGLTPLFVAVDIYVYDMERDELLGTPLVGHTNAVRNLAFSSRGDFLASADDAGNVILWERTSQKRGNFSYQTNLVVSCIVSPGGLNFTPDDDLLVACDDGIKKFDIRHPGSEVENLRLAEASELKRIAFCWRNYIAAEMFETNIVLWDLKQQAEVADFRLDSMPDVKGDNMQALALSA